MSLNDRSEHGGVCVWRMHAKAVDSASEASDSEQLEDDDDDDDDDDARRRSSRHVTRQMNALWRLHIT